MRTAVVTGGAHGIGRAVVDRLAPDGWQVAVLDLEEVAPSGRAALELHCDVTDEAAVRRAMDRAGEQFGALGAIVHCAGKDTYGNALESSAEVFDAAIDLNLRAAWLVAKHGVRYMPASGGSIVLIASVHSFQTRADRFPYPVAKAGMLGLTRSLALDLGDRNIRVNAVCPGFVRTRLLDSALGDGPEAAERLARIEAAHPLGRIGEPEDIAGLVNFLVSDEAAFLTGTSIIADGGLTARLPD